MVRQQAQDLGLEDSQFDGYSWPLHAGTQVRVWAYSKKVIVDAGHAISMHGK